MIFSKDNKGKEKLRKRLLKMKSYRKPRRIERGESTYNKNLAEYYLAHVDRGSCWTYLWVTFTWRLWPVLKLPTAIMLFPGNDYWSIGAWASICCLHLNCRNHSPRFVSDLIAYSGIYFSDELWYGHRILFVQVEVASPVTIDHSDPFVNLWESSFVYFSAHSIWLYFHNYLTFISPTFAHRLYTKT